MKKCLGFLLTPIFLLVWLIWLNVFHVLQIVALKGLGQKAHQNVPIYIVDILPALERRGFLLQDGNVLPHTSPSH
jgi:hypothetical protein